MSGAPNNQNVRGSSGDPEPRRGMHGGSWLTLEKGMSCDFMFGIQGTQHPEGS